MSTQAPSNRYRVTCMGRAFGPEAQAIISEVAPAELEVFFDQDAGEKGHALAAESDFILVTAAVTEPMLKNSPRLKLIHKWGIGVDKIDLAAADREGVYVAITAGANAGAVAEHTIMLILATLRRLSYADRAMHAGRFPHTEMRANCRKISGKTVGILGFGAIGRAVAQRLRGFETKILYYDPRSNPGEVDGETGARFVPFDELIEASDILTIHCPGGGSNRNLIDATRIGQMKRGAVLVNAARGDIVDEEALVAALTSGHLLGAGLDAFEPEPLPPESRLVKLDNVVMTPHSAGSVLDNVAPVATHAFRNMLRIANGEAIPATDLVVTPAKPRNFSERR
jgi:phosphoglycerate dehydrogenase-like enzyme